MSKAVLLRGTHGNCTQYIGDCESSIMFHVSKEAYESIRLLCGHLKEYHAVELPDRVRLIFDKISYSE